MTDKKGCGKGMAVSMLKVAFCDDDPVLMNEMKILFDQYYGEDNRKITCTVFHSSVELLVEIEKGTHFDILFLDIIMPGQNGMSAAREIRQYDHTVKIIFLTSSSEFAVESYMVDAFFYYVKPIEVEAFRRLMDSAVSECGREKQDSLILRCKNGITRIVLKELIYCEVIGRTLVFHTENGINYESIGSLDDVFDIKFGGTAGFRSFLQTVQFLFLSAVHADTDYFIIKIFL